MERNIVLAHELRIAHVLGARIGAPPALPVRTFACVYPFLRTGDVFDGRIKPDIKNLALHPGPVCVTAFDRHAPVQVTCDPTVAQSIPIVQPFFGN